MLGAIVMQRQTHRPVRACSRLSQRGRVAWFLVVGCAAAALHWGVVVVLVRHFEWHPLVANLMAWMMAFSVSFFGHHRLTFRGHGAPAGASALRFFGVSAAGFCINEGAYAVLLHWSRLRYDLVLAGVLVGVAVLTYLSSRHWAFRGSRAP